MIRVFRGMAGAVSKVRNYGNSGGPIAYSEEEIL